MDKILLDDVKLAKAMLIDKKIFEFCGKIEIGRVFDYYDTIRLEQSTGYKLDLLLRLEELSNNYSSRLSISYWVTKTPKTAEELLEYNILAADGFLSIEFDSHEIRYSEYTSDKEYTSELTVGGHDLFGDLKESAGSYLYMMVEF